MPATPDDNGSEALPLDVFSTAQVREFDRCAIATAGIAGIELMNRAGAAAFAAMMRDYPATDALVVYCGQGNNGGDGYVVARLAAAAGLDVRVVALAPPASLGGDAALAAAAATSAGVAVESYGAAVMDPGDLVVDALLGTGLTRDVGGDYAGAIDRINTSGRPVVALDVPSGLDADTGAVRGGAVRADLTVTFGGLKTGLYLGEAPDYCGRVAFSGLGIPGDIVRQAVPVFTRLVPEMLDQELLPRSRMSHKGLNGRLLLIGGSPGMAGAIRLSAEAALRAGAGLVHVATHPDNVPVVMAGRPELMCRGVREPGEISDWLETADAIVIGPGLGQSAWSAALFDAAIACRQPLVIDADGLALLGRHPVGRSGLLLTPHPGEAGRLLGAGTADVQADRLAAITAVAERFGADVILKGACSLVASRQSADQVRIAVCDRGNPGMATAGMGDVLAGIAGSLVAQRRSIDGVAGLATLIHALAGDDAARDGERGLIASDLFGPIRARVNPA